MPKRTSEGGGELFIVDNSHEDWNVLRYLQQWSEFADRLDIATGYFEIGSLLALDGAWQKVEQIRLLMGDEVSWRSREVFKKAMVSIRDRLDASLEKEKEQNDFLLGTPAIVDALRSGQINCRVYRKNKFHAKAYITRSTVDVVPSAALVGSSNFTRPGLSDNIELNVQLAGTDVSVLQEWYDEHWDAAEDVTLDILTVIERHTREYTPFDVYAQGLHHLFRDAPLLASDWEKKPVEDGGSRVFKILDRYQQDGYRSLMEIASKYRGAFLCDGVGLGKTFIGMMLLERLVRCDRQRVVLIVPKAARKAVWEFTLDRFCPDLRKQAFSTLKIINHTDITRESSGDIDWPALMEEIRNEADVVVIDEAHHFRNPGVQVDVDPGHPGKLVSRTGKKPSRYRRLFHMLEGPDGPKRLFLLTATPVNNHISDLRHMMELFTRRDDHFFAQRLGINSLRGHFRKLENAIEARARETTGTEAGQPVDTNMAEAEDVLADDRLFEELVVQRSRKFIQESQKLQHGVGVVFPKRAAPQVAAYTVRKLYGELLDSLEQAFHRQHPLFRLALYNPAAYALEEEDTAEAKIEANRQAQVIGLVRTNFLKRFESSVRAFEASCERLLMKLWAWARVHCETKHEKDRLDKFQIEFEKILGRVEENLEIRDRFQSRLYEEDLPEDLIPPEELMEVEEVDRREFDVSAMFSDTLDDLRQLAKFLKQVLKIRSKDDDKLLCLKDLLTTDSVLKKHKVLIFSEFADTARYIARELQSSGIDGVHIIDGSTPPDRRLGVIERLSPYYNGLNSAKIADRGEDEIRVLISTDVLSEGLNLQDVTRLINYDIHWNPVRLMQRIGRIDRRLDPAIEEAIVADHPDQAPLRGETAYWNFLPTEELDRLLHLYKTVSHKTLRISKTFGIEGKQLLSPQDDFDALELFNATYEGSESKREKLKLEYDRLLKKDPALSDHLDALPGRVFSGRMFPVDATGAVTAPAVYFCYALPGLDVTQPKDAPTAERWTEQSGEVRWYLLDIDSGTILEDPAAIAEFIRSTPDTPRRVTIEQTSLVDARRTVEKHITKSYLRAVNADVGVRPRLVAWMEVN